MWWLVHLEAENGLLENSLGQLVKALLLCRLARTVVMLYKVKLCFLLGIVERSGICSVHHFNQASNFLLPYISLSHVQAGWSMLTANFQSLAS